jgi:large subunit ribosomal protein L49
MNLNYAVKRTLNDSLPVYKVFKTDGRQVNTVVKGVTGDFEMLRKKLSEICESPVRVKIGSLEIRGLHTWKVKEYLESIGF